MKLVINSLVNSLLVKYLRLSVRAGQCEHIACPDIAGAAHHPEIKLQRNT